MISARICTTPLSLMHLPEVAVVLVFLPRPRDEVDEDEAALPRPRVALPRAPVAGFAFAVGVVFAADVLVPGTRFFFAPEVAVVLVVLVVVVVGFLVAIADGQFPKKESEQTRREGKRTHSLSLSFSLFLSRPLLSVSLHCSTSLSLNLSLALSSCRHHGRARFWREMWASKTF